jgi:iron(III) transport system ATP-binding protein
MTVAGRIEVEGLEKRFGETPVVKDVSFVVEPGEVVALLGPSGCGKTTTLKCVAGLERPDAGSIRLGDKMVFDAASRTNLPPNRRELGMVFQSYAVWPHMTVFGNVAFPLQVRRMGKPKLRERVMTTLELVGLEPFADRAATELSGGQQQRVALARALVGEPEVILFDEPLSNLDARLRERMRFELAELQDRVGYTGIYVTHDQEEAMAVATRLVVMHEGEVKQSGPADAVYGRPRNAFVARFMGIGNALSGKVAGGGPDTLTVRLGSGEELRAAAGSALEPGAAVTVFFAPEALRATPEPDDNRLRGVVHGAIFLGYGFDYQIEMNGSTQIRFRELGAGRQLRVGDAVTLGVPPAACTAVPAEE